MTTLAPMRLAISAEPSAERSSTDYVSPEISNAQPTRNPPQSFVRSIREAQLNALFAPLTWLVNPYAKIMGLRPWIVVNKELLWRPVKKQFVR